MPKELTFEQWVQGKIPDQSHKRGRKREPIPTGPIHVRYTRDGRKGSYRKLFKKYLVITLWKSQNGKCALCKRVLGKNKRWIFLDHCHETGYIRGLLCISCNTRLGWYELRRKDIEDYRENYYHHLG